MVPESTTSIVLYGDVDTHDSAGWANFYESAKAIIASTGGPANYIGASSPSFRSGKVLMLKRVEKRLFKAFAAGEEFKHLSVERLPSDFHTATFDFDVYIDRTTTVGSFILATFRKSIFEEVNENEVVAQLKQTIEFTKGEVFEMAGDEVPLLYASRVNDDSVYKSLKVLRKF